eukprot:15230634-Ditylum_brightwellii.AAC.1
MSGQGEKYDHRFSSFLEIVPNPYQKNLPCRSPVVPSQPRTHVTNPYHNQSTWHSFSSNNDKGMYCLKVNCHANTNILEFTHGSHPCQIQH